MKVNATVFKAKCLALIDRVHTKGEVVTITKRGRGVAKLVGAGETDDRPWLALRGQKAPCTATRSLQSWRTTTSRPTSERTAALGA